MAAAPIKIVAPLEGDEIRKGIAAMIHAKVPGLPVDSIESSLSRSCSFNAQSFSRVRATWWVDCDDDNVAYQWWVDYELDDFGRIDRGGIGGMLGMPCQVERVEGVIEPMPPDRFRRETAQPIPSNVVIPKQDDGLGLSRTPKSRVKGKDA